MSGNLDRLSDTLRETLRPVSGAPEPGSPMLAVLSSRRTLYDGWLFERKLDGVRALGTRGADGAHVHSRTGRLLDATYPELVEALGSQPTGDFLVDGEIVALTRRRSGDWVKLKCGAGQELVVGGFTEPAGTRIGLGALLVGYYQDGNLRYAGEVGTGFSTEVLHDLRGRLDGIRRSTSPFQDEVRERGAHWVRPEVVAQIGFTEWTSGGRLRHPRFLGLRTDKRATEVVRETPVGGSS